jgi:hypothetical protein
MKSKLLAAGLVSLLTLGGCVVGSSGDSSETGGTPGSGGHSGGTDGKGGSNTGGTSNTGGSSNTGGTSNTGGSSNTGGTSSTGGSSNSGGKVGTGGKTATGGSTGAGGIQGDGGSIPKGTGGSAGSSGKPDGGGVGGKQGTGGSPGNGGSTGQGGGPGNGGSTGTPIENNCTLPPGPSSGVAKPTGSATKLDVLPWAGFKAATSFSLDDGNSSQIQNYNTLNGMGVKLTFYLVTGWSSASDPIWKQAIKDGHEIGNHTQSHDCSTASQGQSDLKSKLGVTAYTMAAPNGNTACGSSVDSLNLLLNRGVNGGSVSFTADDSSVAKNLPTNLPPSGASASSLTSPIDSAYSKGEWSTFCIHGFTGDSNAYQPFPLSSLTDAVKTEKQKKDLWIDTMQAVGAYWRAGRAFAKATKSTSGSDTTWKWTVPKNNPPNTCLRVKSDGGVVKQKGAEVPWDDHGYYEISFDAGEVTLSAQ